MDPCKILGFFIIPSICAFVFSYGCIQGSAIQKEVSVLRENVYENVGDLPNNTLSVLKVNMMQPFGSFEIYEEVHQEHLVEKDNNKYVSYTNEYVLIKSGLTHPDLKVECYLVTNNKAGTSIPWNGLKMRDNLKLGCGLVPSNDFKITRQYNQEKIVVSLGGQKMLEYFDEIFPNIYNLSGRSPFDWNKNYKLFFFPITGETLFVSGNLNANDDLFKYIAINNTLDGVVNETFVEQNTKAAVCQILSVLVAFFSIIMGSDLYLHVSF